jgi:CCR4-NOT transcription complex subunit 1
MEHLRERLIIWFREWVNIYQRTQTPEKSFIPYITALTKQGILKAEEISLFFFRVCAETSLKSYIVCATSGDFANAYHALDAMSRLITLLIKYHVDATGVNNEGAKVHYLTKILSIFVLVLAKEHEERGVNFPQKPFFRFFSTLINDFHAIEASMGTAYTGLLYAIRCAWCARPNRGSLLKPLSSDAFSTLQPTYFPGFTFSWMCLISHRYFMPKLLTPKNREVSYSSAKSVNIPAHSYTHRDGLHSTSYFCRSSNFSRPCFSRPTSRLVA